VEKVESGQPYAGGMDWLSPTMGGMLGLTGLGAGWRIAVRARRHDAGDWHRERRADAYVELLEVAQDMGQVVTVMDPMGDRNPPRPLPPLPSGDRQGQARARVAAFGSRTVRQATDRWCAAVATVLHAADGVAHGVDGASHDLDAARAAERNARAELDQAINDDLRG
jgi:hypothetical protein